MNSLRDEAQHLRGNIQTPDLGLRLHFPEHARESALAAAYVQNAASAKIPQVLADQLDMVNTRINGGRKMFFVARGLVEGGLNLCAQLRRELRVFGFGKQPLPVQA